MELVTELAVLRRSSLSWEHIVRWWLVFAVLGMLCIGSRSYAKDSSVKPKGEIVNYASGESIVNPSAKKCGRNAKNAAVQVGEDTGILAYTWKREIVKVSAMPDETVWSKALEASERPRPAEEREIAEEEEPAAVKAAELPVFTETEPVGGSLDILEMLCPPKETEQELDSRIMPDTGKQPDSSFVEEDETEMPSVRKEIPAVEEDENEYIPPVGADEETAENGGAKEPELRETAGFLVDEDGYITGVTERIDLTDGILIFARDESCIGIREGALSELAGCVWEIYLPSNICEIEPGAFDIFESSVYIEAAGDHPCYYSENGVLYPKE